MALLKKKKTPEQKKVRKEKLKKIGKVGLAVQTGGASLLLEKKNRKKLGKAVKKAGSKLEKGLKKVVTKAKDVPFAPLYPFKKVMTNALDSRNIKHSSELSDIVPKFYQHIVRNNFDSSKDQAYFASNVDMVLENHVDGKQIASSVAKSGGQGALNIVAKAATGDIVGASAGIVTEILNYLRKLKDKKDKIEQQKANGEPITDPLTPAEEKVLNESEKVATNLKDAVVDEAEMTVAMKVKEFLFSWKGAVLLAVLAIIIYMAFFKKK